METSTYSNTSPLGGGNVAAKPTLPAVRKISLSDLHDALRLGWDDFKAVPSHAIMLCAIYPVLGLMLARAVLGYSVLPLLFPLAAGFALLGPFAALGLYELSRRRELGEAPSAWQATSVLHSPSFGSMLALGILLLTLFVVWVATAQAIYVGTFGYEPAADIPGFASRVLATPEGWRLIIIGCGVGFLFALVALCLTVVSFPMMLDRHATAADAMLTSMRVMAANPITMAAWGVIVAGLLLFGSIPFFLGLAVVVPLLGHATWHLYRKALEPNPNPQSTVLPPQREHRSAADFPAALFPWQHKKP